MSGGGKAEDYCVVNSLQTVAGKYNLIIIKLSNNVCVSV